MSTTVSNPYSFNIKNNTSFSTSIAANLPSSETLLDDISDTFNKNYKLTIPKGVNIIYCSGIVEAGVDARNGEAWASLIIQNNANGKYWNNDSETCGGGDYASASCQVYIGVTPGKVYDLRIDTSSGFVEDPGWKISDVKIYYSASINNQTPNVTDY